MTLFKPEGYNSLSPYLIADDAKALAAQLTNIFGATELRKYERQDGVIQHLELKIDDSILMISNSVPGYPATKTVLHLYVPDVHAVWKLALENGAVPIQEPVNKGEDPDVRGSFYDLGGNWWSVGMQMV